VLGLLIGGGFDTTTALTPHTLGMRSSTATSICLNVIRAMLDYACDPAGAVHYATIGVIQGMQHLPATFTPGPRLGIPLDQTLDMLQQACDQQRLAEPVTRRHQEADIRTPADNWH
jgi:hypothetical protein